MTTGEDPKLAAAQKITQGQSSKQVRRLKQNTQQIMLCYFPLVSTTVYIPTLHQWTKQKQLEFPDEWKAVHLCATVTSHELGTKRGSRELKGSKIPQHMGH